jgi:hypothetical protein
LLQFANEDCTIYVCDAGVGIPLFVRAVAKGAPMKPPITPPTACNAAHPRTPPQLTKAGAAIKNNPIIEPATAAEKTEIKTKLIVPVTGFSKQFLYPISLVSTSKTKLAAVKPKKKKASGLNMKFITVAIKPTAVAVPNFRVTHTAKISEAKPIKSQRKGK